MLKSYKILSILLCNVMLLSACTQSFHESENLSETSEKSDTVVSDTATDSNSTTTESLLHESDLEINLHLDGKNNYMQLLIDQFKEEHPEITVNITDYSDLLPADYRTVLSTQMMSGEGPDVLLIINTGNETLTSFPEMTKMLQNDVFLDVNTLGVDFSDCNETVMKAGIFQDQQLFVPLNYSLGFLYTTEERLKEAGISYYDGITLEEFASAFPAFYKNHPEKKAFLNWLSGQDLFAHNSIDLVDYTNNQMADSEKNQQNLEKLTHAFDNLFPEIFSSSEVAMDYMFYLNLNKYGSTDREIYQSGDLLFMSGRGFSGAYDNLLTYNNSIYPDDISKGETPIIFAMPTITGESPSPNVTYMLAINANIENTEAVKLFIETAIGTDFQYTTTGTGIPVNQELVDRMKTFYLTEGYDPKDPYLFPKACEFDQKFVESYFNVIENMSDPIPFMDSTTTSYIFSIIRNSIKGDMTFEEAYSSVKSQINFYLSE